ncbi:GAF domain-containing protein [Cellulomonas hominis]
MPGREDAVAWPAGGEPGPLLARVRAAHEQFVTTGLAPASVRPVVADSWRRSARSGVDPERPLPPVELEHNDLVAYRRSHPLVRAMPLVRRLLVDGVGDGVVVALTDDQGRLLWVEGDAAVRRAVEQVGFVEGASWREEHAGTNAPGTALATHRAVQVLGPEHFTRPVQPWSCSAVPVHDLTTGEVLGVLDVTGGADAASPLMLSLVRATVTAVELDLAARRRGTPRRVLHTRPAGAPNLGAPRLEVMGPAGGLLRDVASGAAESLSLRHAEILLLLAEHPRGLHADELAALLYPGEPSDVTVRAEMSRLRRVVGPLLGPSRPYRLTGTIGTDLDDLRRLLRAGDVLCALTRCPGQVLTRSRAPGVERLREEWTAELRGAVLAARDPAVVGRWVAGDDGADDWQAWELLVALTRAGSPEHVRARARLELLAQEIGPGPARHPWH